jgi:hypothetical protein
MKIMEANVQNRRKFANIRFAQKLGGSPKSCNFAKQPLVLELID